MGTLRPDPLTNQPLARRVGGVASLVALAALVAGCSSPAVHQARATTTTRPPSRSTTTTTSTTVPPTSTTTAPPVVSSHVVVGISGPSATIEFTSSDISGSVLPQTGTFSQGGTVYTFAITGVRYAGAPSTTRATGGLIASVTVSGASTGAQVTVTLTSPASHASYGLGHNEVGVSFS
jgi:hypothetical protein